MVRAGVDILSGGSVCVCVLVVVRAWELVGGCGLSGQLSDYIYVDITAGTNVGISVTSDITCKC